MQRDRPWFQAMVFGSKETAFRSQGAIERCKGTALGSRETLKGCKEAIACSQGKLMFSLESIKITYS